MSVQMTQTDISNIPREARKLFRDKKYQELVELVQDQDRNSYVDSLYLRALQLVRSTPSEAQTVENTPLKEGPSDLQATDIQKSITETPQESIPPTEKRSNDDKNLPHRENKKWRLLQWRHNKEQGKKIKSFTSLLTDRFTKKEVIQQEEKQGGEVDETIKKDLQNKEMEIAQNVQAKLIPKIDSNILPGIESSVKTLSCSELSGDVYDFITQDKNESIFYLGDVTGHGTAAGLVMTMINVLTHTIVARSKNIASILITLNREIKPKLANNMFTTMIMCKWNAPLRKFSFAGAGHEYILHYHAKTKEIEKIRTGGIAIGMLADISKIVKEQELFLENDDIVMLYTDGLDEAWDVSGKNRYSLSRLEKDLKETVHLPSVNEMSDTIFKRVETYQGGKALTDDMTLMLFKRSATRDEDDIKKKYLKESLKEKILKNEGVIADSSNNPSPDIKRNQDDYVKDIKQLVAVYMDEDRFFEAREELKKALRIASQDEELQTLYQEVEVQILSKKAKGGLWNKLKYAFNTFMAKALHRRYDRKKEYLNLLKNKFKEAEGEQNIEKMKEIKEEIKKIDPKNNLVKKIEKIEAKEQTQRPAPNIENFFELKIASPQTKEPIKDSAEQTQKKDLKSALFNSLQEQILVKTQDEEGEEKTQEEEIIEEIKKDYNPKSALSLTKNDVLGLRKLLKITDQKPGGGKAKENNAIENSFSGGAEKRSDGSEHQGFDTDKRGEIVFGDGGTLFPEETKKEKKEIQMQWEKGSDMERKRKKYSKFMAKISPMNKNDLFTFIDKLSSFVKAGIPIQKAIEIMQTQAKNDGFIYVLDELIKALDSGKVLSQAMQMFPEHFPEMLIYLVHAGEKSGALAVILEDITEQMKEHQLVVGKIKSAMTYPTFIIFASMLILVGMLVFIVPRLTKVYGDTGVELPMITQKIVQLSSFLQNHYILVVLGIIGFALSTYFFGKTKQGIKIYHKIFLKMPVISNVAKLNNVMLFTTNSAILLQNGIQLVEALDIVSKITPNHYYKKAINGYREKMISTGESLSETMGAYDEKENKYFPLEVVQTIHTGEQTGSLANMMHSTGAMYKEELKNTVKGLSDIFEPFLMFFVGGMVATILLAVMFPLFNLGKVMRGQG
ncbi:SpoIIE family protein phosphatase [Candidatus Peregrinibacteria bacterium]|nr:SpoIIE family protein phosphatase [Candidatus Peregrinibacteria bacterium]